ncbi:glycoside hydrolase [Rhizoclosmatium globosum]|uniref:Glycoside hydrolase n=1 Tax=Rhizoclosmatium globosum TaxID=329046 RepID=A0A1Y2CQD0_9FUNG|nr:glycoside hydrolase [Rhizoclosmatium globosum]|eukprot:ORY48555.1 glycoside hydrolase [Rhizoclosmatium globosum]
MQLRLPLLTAAVLASTACAQVRAPLYEPADGKVLFGAWVDTEDPSTNATNIGIGGDSPVKFNQRLGSNAAVFHFSQRLPLDISPYTQEEMTVPLKLVEDTATDAILFITVYPIAWTYTDKDVQKLAWQLGNITDPSLSNRRVMLRFAPEMNGNWFSYGQQPTRFVQEYKRIVDNIRSVTSRVSFVWAPNAADGYPFGVPLAAYELSALDTNKNGALDYGDDPFTPYWPGEDYVDWVGISLYWKGNPATGTPPHDNSASPADYWEQMVQGGPSGSNPAFPFYDMFALKYNKPLVMPEGGAAFALTQAPNNTPLPANVGQVKIQQTFWKSYLGVLSKYPKAKMFINFEYLKLNEDPVANANNGVTRDYRITWDSATVAALKADLSALGSTVQWASSPGSSSTPGNSVSTTSKSSACTSVFGVSLLATLAVLFV